MVFSYIMLILLLILSVVLIYCILKSKKYAGYIEAIDAKEFPGSEFFGIGFAFADLIKVDFSSESAQKIREQIVVLYGKKYSDFYLRVSYAQKFTYAALLAYLGLFMGCAVGGVDGLMLGALGILVAVVVYVYYTTIFKEKIEKLNDQYMSDFPNAISTIALLVNAGMFLRDAWREVAFSGQSPLYKQMQKVVEDMNNGVSEGDAIFAFANRCSTKEIRKFSSMIIQAIEKGGRELADSLAKQADLLLNSKRQRTLQLGEKASSKLMIPISVMFMAILVIVMVPVLTNLGI